MNYYSFKFKILLIFTIPIISILYFAYNSLTINYEKLQNAYQIQNSSKLTQTLTKLIYNIQLERGLSAGYISVKNKREYKYSLLKQYESTDKSIKKFIEKIYSSRYSKLYLRLNNNHIKEKLIIIENDLFNRKRIRDAVLNSSIKFEDEIKYYSDINKKIIFNIKLLNSINEDFQIDTTALLSLESIKEYAGLQRAYIYHQLLGETKKHLLNKLEIFKIREENAIEHFFIYSSKESIHIYEKNFSSKLMNDVIYCIDGLLKNSLDITNAKTCFNISTKYIDSISNISKVILENYLANSKTVEDNALRSLYLIVILWIISILALLYLIYILKNMLKAEELYVKKLLIASYAFDSQEAMVVTDPNAIIIEVNNAFTEITGYTKEEAIGKNTSILNSNKHDDYFFKKMWFEVVTNGKWNGEILNKRKNGEIYPERLSITAIEDKYGNITNYIAQFIDISDIKEAQKIAEHQASHDFLSGLLNKKALVEKLNEEFKKAIRYNFKHAFIFIDLDYFKAVNDEYGHAIGDELIIEVSSRLKESIRDEDIVARLSGDEFAIIIFNLDANKEKRLKDIEHICNKVLNAISSEFILHGNSINISASIGIKQFPSYENNIQDIMTHADTAMYKSKRDGKNKFTFFTTPPLAH